VETALDGHTGRAYSGVNVLLLWATAAERGYPSAGWLTFKQALDAGGHVRKGEKGTRVIFVSTFEKTDATTGETGRRCRDRTSAAYRAWKAGRDARRQDASQTKEPQ